MAKEIVPREQRVDTVIGLIEANKAALAAALPQVPGMEITRWSRLLVNALRKTPALADCTPGSLMEAMMVAAGSGLPVGVSGGVYLIPYGKEVQAQFDYRAYIALARRSGKIDGVWAEVVYSKDKFHVVYGPGRTLKHEPYQGADHGERVAVYCCWRWAVGGQVDWCVLWDWQVKERQAMSRASGPDSPWTKWPDEMWRKTVIRHASDYWPLEPEERDVLGRNDEEPVRTVEVRQVDAGPTLDTMAAQLREQMPPGQPGSAKDAHKQGNGEAPAAKEHATASVPAPSRKAEADPKADPMADRETISGGDLPEDDDPAEPNPYFTP